MVNRDRHDIAIEILKETVSGKKKTELMSDVGLSYSQSKQYLEKMLENGLLEIDDKKRFKTTKKGQDFVKKCGECWLFNWDKQKR
jgi:predicted transcriptional regulator